ncbi:FUN14 domain-containing protein 1 [Modicella reniformis]|uniref:FUN14 domain-containing protein 1 n=1 Tax=Modicella reniformis TaxID=1440133 RepID=A0A9P6INU6_9FUNG|nr:FUN14 domain-containing protein 1 [Modicella reniformis]
MPVSTAQYLLLRPHLVLRGAVRSVSILAEPACLKTTSPSAFLRQNQRFASSTSAPMLHHEPWIAAGAIVTSVAGPLIFSRSTVLGCSFAPFSASHRRVAHCAAVTRTSDTRITVLDDEPLINSKELTFGMVMGLCSGFLFKKLGKMMMLVVGFGFVWLQLLSSSGYIHINWTLIERRFKGIFDADGDGKVTMNDAKHGFRWLMGLLTKNFQFKSSFSVAA